ncbi:MAG: NADP-dependent oxidoreductase [Candidatus Saccharimonadales bacterium]
MKAARIEGYGGKDVLRIMDTPKPRPGRGQVLVEVRAAGVNPFDWKVREGMVRGMAELELPATLGGDVAGVITEIGEGVTDFEPGQAVYGQAGALSGEGSFAEYTAVKVSQLSAKPQSLDFVQAASLPLAAASAYQALVDHMHLQKGRKILIHGAAGGIGSIAVQLAKHLGAYVAATASAEDGSFVKGLGADEVIDYHDQDFTEIIKDYDDVFDTVGGETNTKSYAVLRPGGILVSMTGGPDDELVKKYQIEYVAQASRTTQARLEAVAGLVDSGAIKPQVAKVFPLDQAAEALEYQKTGKPEGKVVIRVR